MAKVQATRLPVASASCTRASIVYNILFTLNLVSTPFLAYLAEPLPGSTDASKLPVSTTFDEFVNVTTAYFKQLYNNQTMQPDEVSRRELLSNRFVWRQDLVLPYEIPQDEAFDYMIRIPASLFFGQSQRSFIHKFLTSNATSRYQIQPWQMCQRNLVLNMIMSESCTWLEETGSSHYRFWLVIAMFPYLQGRVIKLIFRSTLTAYVTYILWCRYYRHYVVLLSNLRHFGLSCQYTRYEIVVGDPAYAILSDPVLSLAMVVDILSSILYSALALLQVSQFHDMWLYTSGCVYLARGVWYGFLFMRVFSMVVKTFGWEKSFAPVDPGMLTICAYLYNGPLMSLVGGTRLQSILQETWSWFLPHELREQAIECITATVMVVLIMAILPLVFSWVSSNSFKCHQVHPTTLKSRTSVSTYTFNDLKARILLSLTMQKHVKHEIGGSLHKLYNKNPRYRKIPLFSHSAADCYILCYTPDGTLDQRVRLSLVSCLDRQVLDPKHAISICTTMHSTPVCILNNEGCDTFMPISKDAQFEPELSLKDQKLESTHLSFSWDAVCYRHGSLLVSGFLIMIMLKYFGRFVLAPNVIVMKYS
ncbi:hypothetical protein AeRB84_014556 [Aphanomyces euteiches]|nr:hypothetical protein AeRB84_014556 [Aphanomyces euteiches]